MPLSGGAVIRPLTFQSADAALKQEQLRNELRDSDDSKDGYGWPDPRAMGELQNSERDRHYHYHRSAAPDVSALCRQPELVKEYVDCVFHLGHPTVFRRITDQRSMAGTAPTDAHFTRTRNAGPVHCSVWLAFTRLSVGVNKRRAFATNPHRGTIAPNGIDGVENELQ